MKGIRSQEKERQAKIQEKQSIESHRNSFKTSKRSHQKSQERETTRVTSQGEADQER